MPAYEIEVVNLDEDRKAEYIGMFTPLGNPYEIRNERDRDIIIDIKYKTWLQNQVKNDPDVRTELRRLDIIGKKKGKLKLGSLSYPKKCHCIVIKEYLESGDLLS